MIRLRRTLRESAVEKYLCEQVAARKGIAEKFKSPNRRSVPDRIVLWPEDWSQDCEPCPARVHFVEVKRLGEPPTTPQARDHARRRAMGFVVEVVDSYAAVDSYIVRFAP